MSVRVSPTEVKPPGCTTRFPTASSTAGRFSYDDGRMSARHRCGWAKSDLMIAYHDTGWGVPQHDDRVLFEFLILEGAQAGLSWETILKKRENYRAAFDGFDPAKIARYDARRMQKLMSNDGIVRNRLKIVAAVQNARSFLA